MRVMTVWRKYKVWSELECLYRSSLSYDASRSEVAWLVLRPDNETSSLDRRYRRRAWLLTRMCMLSSQQDLFSNLALYACFGPQREADTACFNSEMFLRQYQSVSLNLFGLSCQVSILYFQHHYTSREVHQLRIVYITRPNP